MRVPKKDGNAQKITDKSLNKNPLLTERKALFIESKAGDILHKD